MMASPTLNNRHLPGAALQSALCCFAGGRNTLCRGWQRQAEGKRMDLGINNCRAIFTGPRAIDGELVARSGRAVARSLGSRRNGRNAATKLYGFLSRAELLRYRGVKPSNRPFAPQGWCQVAPWSPANGFGLFPADRSDRTPAARNGCSVPKARSRGPLS